MHTKAYCVGISVTDINSLDFQKAERFKDS